MKIHATRDSVSSGDDIHAPHSRLFTLPKSATLNDMVSMIVEESYLPFISGGKATWCISTRVPLAIIAQQWNQARIIQAIAPELSEFLYENNCICVHATYFAQQDPELVFDVLQRLRFPPA